MFKSKNILREISDFLAVLVILFSMSPFFVWEKPWLFIFVGCCIGLLLVVFFKKNVDKENLKLFLLITSFLVYLSIPFREYDSLSFKSPFSLLVLLFILLISKKDYSWFFNKLRTIFYYITLSSIISWCLFLLDFPFPVIEIPQSYRPQETDKYFLYYGFCYLNSQVQNIGGITVMRNVGWFGEPGHFGIYLCMFLIGQKYIFKGKINRTFIVGILTTMSLASILLLIIITLIKSRAHHFIFFSVILLIIFLLIPQDVLYSLILIKFKSENVLLDRSLLPLNLLDLDLISLFFGYGSDFLSSNGYYSSDMRGFIFKYGLISILLSLIPVLYISWYLYFQVCRNYAYLLAVFFMFIFLHRSWMIDTLYMWFFICNFFYITLPKLSRNNLNDTFKLQV